MTLEEKIQNLIDAANNATGEADETLTDAVGSLIDGYGGGGSVLPAGYTQIEYLESSGTQWIDTGLYPDNTCSIDVEYRFIGSTVNYPALYGVTLSGGGTLYLNIYKTAPNSFGVIESNFNLFWGVEQKYNNTLIANAKTRIIHDVNGLKCYDNESYEVSGTGDITVTDPAGTIALFGRKSASTGAASYLAIARIYRFRFSLDGALTADLVPAIRDSDSKPGMYDIVRNEFYTNAGTGEFTVPSGA